MTQRRYVANFWATTTDPATLTNITRPYWNAWGASETDEVGRLEEFLQSRKEEFGDNLQWVAVEKSESAINFIDSDTEWMEVKRLSAKDL